MRDLLVESHARVLCVPANRIKHIQFGISYRIGAYLPNGDFISAVALRRDRGISDRADPECARRVMAGDFIYGGLLRRHFGHFLLESLARVWALQAHSQLPIVWHLDGDSQLAAWQTDIFKLLNIDPARFHYLVEPTEFEMLHIPEVGYRIQDWAHPRQIGALACFKFGEPVAGSKLWLSRSRLPQEAGNVSGVTQLEAQLLAEGWLIIHPQELSIEEQLQTIARSEIVAGFEGSALHTLILADKVQGRVVVVPRGEEINRNYLTIAEAKCFDQNVIAAELKHLGGSGPKSQYEIKNLDVLVDALRCA